MQQNVPVSQPQGKKDNQSHISSSLLLFFCQGAADHDRLIDHVPFHATVNRLHVSSLLLSTTSSRLSRLRHLLLLLLINLEPGQVHLFGPHYDADRAWMKAEWDKELPSVRFNSSFPSSHTSFMCNISCFACL